MYTYTSTYTREYSFHVIVLGHPYFKNNFISLYKLTTSLIRTDDHHPNVTYNLIRYSYESFDEKLEDNNYRLFARFEEITRLNNYYQITGRE